MAGPTGNLLLDQMTVEDRAAVLALATPVEFQIHEIFAEPEHEVRSVHFVLDGIISAVAETTDGRSVEALMAGFDGLNSATAALVPTTAYMRETGETPGRALRVDAERLRELGWARPRLRTVLTDYVSGQQQELAQSIACNTLHRSDQRLAKWLLRAHDRVRGDVLPFTQEYLAAMLGSQRTTVNEGVQRLETTGAVAHSRGAVRVLDRARLERAACECYRRLPVAG